MSINAELTRRLKIKAPIVQGGMQWVGYAELAAAVSNAGGLGILTALTQPTPTALRSEIRRCRTMTSRPFGVNITLLPSLVPRDYKAFAHAAVAEGVHIFETAGNSPKPIVEYLKAQNCIVIHKYGFECAGHVGESDVTDFILLSRARQTLQTPFIASGGFADRSGLAAALALGAEGINMGTRFMCTIEAPIHVKINEAIVAAEETDTQLVLLRWRNTNQLFKNKVSVQVSAIETESESGKFEEVAPLMSGKRGRQVFLNGEMDFGVWTAGQVIGLIHDIPSCEDLITRIEAEAVLAV